MGSLLRTSEAGSIGLHAMCLLAKSPDEVTKSASIAKTLDISHAHLTVVMRQLARARIVTSVLGPGGGYKLGKPPHEISLLDVLQCIDGPVGDSACICHHARCSGKECVMGVISSRVNDFVVSELGRITLAKANEDPLQLVSPSL